MNSPSFMEWVYAEFRNAFPEVIKCYKCSLKNKRTFNKSQRNIIFVFLMKHFSVRGKASYEQWTCSIVYMCQSSLHLKDFLVKTCITVCYLTPGDRCPRWPLRARQQTGIFSSNWGHMIWPCGSRNTPVGEDSRIPGSLAQEQQEGSVVPLSIREERTVSLTQGTRTEDGDVTVGTETSRRRQLPQPGQPLGVAACWTTNVNSNVR